MIRRCRECGRESHVNKPKEGWKATTCTFCGALHGPAIELGLDRVEDPSAPGWPSGDTLQQRKDAAYDSFVHPSRKA